MNPFYSLILLFLLSSAASAFGAEPLSCSSLLNTSSEHEVVLKNLKASIVSDAYQKLDFPHFIYNNSRPIKTSEVQEVLNFFYRYYLDSLSYANGLPPEEYKIFSKVASDYLKMLELFAANYNDFDLTSSKISKLRLLSNGIKGRAFEALVQLILVRSDFEIIGTNMSLEALRGFLKVKGPKLNFKEEFDIVARHSGVVYVFELKSISPTSNNIEKTIIDFEKQTSRQSEGLVKLGLRDRIKFIGLSHFDIGVSAESLPGLDGFIYLREGYGERP